MALETLNTIIQKHMTEWECRYCGHTVLTARGSSEPPAMKWSDGHTCLFVQVKEEVKK